MAEKTGSVYFNLKKHTTKVAQLTLLYPRGTLADLGDRTGWAAARGRGRGAYPSSTRSPASVSALPRPPCQPTAHQTSHEEREAQRRADICPGSQLLRAGPPHVQHSAVTGSLSGHQAPPAGEDVRAGTNFQDEFRQSQGSEEVLSATHGPLSSKESQVNLL